MRPLDFQPMLTTWKLRPLGRPVWVLYSVICQVVGLLDVCRAGENVLNLVKGFNLQDLCIYNCHLFLHKSIGSISGFYHFYTHPKYISLAKQESTKHLWRSSYNTFTICLPWGSQCKQSSLVSSSSLGVRTASQIPLPAFLSSSCASHHVKS